ncbi:hypothetical protein ACOSP7_020364 [Xanthoceras sorbifolium]
MSSYRPYPPPQSSYQPPPPPPPNQNPPQQPPPPPPPSQQQPPHRPNYNQNWGYPSRPPPPPPHQQYPYGAPPPPPPPPESSYPPPPPPPPQQGGQPQMYYPPNQYSQSSMYNLQPPMQPLQPPLPPPPPLSPPPPGSSIPPPPPPSSPPPPPPRESDGGDTGVSDRDKRVSREVSRREHGHSRQQRPPVPPPQAGKKVNTGGSGRVETEDERRLRKKREYEKQRQEEKHRQQMKESQNAIMQKTQMMGAGKGGGGHGSIVGSRMGDRRATPFLGAERVENRLKKPTTFVCKMKFRNELPDPSAQMKLMFMKKDKDRFTKYRITSLEKEYKPQLYVEPDLGIPLDLLDLSVYNPPKGYVRPPLDPEDEELLRDDDVVTPVKKDGIRRKERPTDKGVSWLVKTQYISPLSMESTRQSLTEKQAKELREMRGGLNPLGNHNSRERQIKEIEATFEASKLPPVHATNKNLHPVEIMPLLPDFDRYEDQFVVASFDGAPTADSEHFGKLDQSVREAHESRAVMKSYVATGADPANPEKFLAYMVPSADEVSREDMYDEDEDTSFSWVREYHWDVRGDDADDPATYLVSFDDGEARYVPLPTKLNLRKKRAREGRSNEEVEHFPVPARVTVRKRPTVAAIEVKDSGVYSNSKGNASSSKTGKYDPDDELGRSGRGSRQQDLYHSSGAEDDMSE